MKTDSIPEAIVARCRWVRWVAGLVAVGWVVAGAGAGRAAEPGTVIWQTDLEADFATIPALGPDGSVYVGIWSESDTNRVGVTALSPEGQMQWIVAGSATTPGAPVVGGDGTIYASFFDGLVLALHADGSSRWAVRLEQALLYPVAVGADGAVYLGGRRPFGRSDLQDLMHCFNSDGTVRWQVPGGHCRPMIGENGVIFPGEGSPRIGALNPDGTMLWDVGASGGVVGSALGPGNRLYSGISGFGLRAYEREGGLLWEFNPGGSVTGSPAVAADGRILVVSQGGLLHCLSPEGVELWNLALNLMQHASPAISASGTVYVGAEGNRLLALDLSGNELWSVALSANVLDAPLITPEGRVCLGTLDRRVWMIEGDGSGPSASPWPMRGANARRGSSLQTGFETPGQPENVVASDGDYTDRLDVSWDSAAHAQWYEVWRSQSHDHETAILLEDRVAGRTSLSDHSALPGVDYYYWVRGANSAGVGAISAAATGSRRIAVPGEVVWRLSAGEEIVHPPTLGEDGRFIYLSRDGNAWCYRSDGVRLWEYKSAEAFTFQFMGPAVIGDNGDTYLVLIDKNFEVTPSGSRLVSLSPEGEERWRLVFDAPAAGAPALGPDGRVYFGLREDPFEPPPDVAGLYAVAPDGEIEWSYRFSPGVISTPLVHGDGTIVFTSEDSHAWALNPDGSLLWKVPMAAEWSAPLALAPEGMNLMRNERGLEVWNPDGTRLWGRDTTAGHPLFALISDDGHIVCSVGGGQFRSLTLTGTHLWQRFIDGDIAGTLAAGSRALLPGRDRLHVLDSTGVSVAEYPLPVNLRVGTTVILSTDGIAYFGGTDHHLYGIKTAYQPGEGPWPSAFHDTRHTSRSEEILASPETPVLDAVSDRTSPTFVRVNWSSAGRARYYQVWRSETEALEDAVLLADRVSGTTEYEDRSADAEVAYHYWIKAVNAAGESGFSEAGEGVRRQPQPGELLETWLLRPGIQGSPALAPDGTLRLGLNFVPGLIGSGDSPWGVLSLNPDGKVRWRHELHEYIVATPAVREDGSLVVSTVQGKTLALDAEGNRLWEHEAGWFMRASPGIDHQGRAIVPAGDGFVYAFNEDGSLSWKHYTAAANFSSPAIGPDGGIYFLSQSNRVYALNADGTRRWEVLLSGGNLGDAPWNSSPALAEDGTIHVAGGASLFALNQDGTVQWQRDFQGGIPGSPVLGEGGRVYITCFDRKLHVLEGDGTPAWELETGGVVASTPALGADGVVYFGSSDQNFYAVDTDGSELWRFATEGRITGSALIDEEGVVYVASEDGRLYALQGSAPPAQSAWPAFRHGPARHGRRSGVVSPPGQPAGLTASEGDYHDRITVSWHSTPGAWRYDVLRSTRDDPASAHAIAVGLTATTNFIDTAVTVGVPYHYWVVARNSTTETAISTGVMGFRRAAYAGEPVLTYNHSGELVSSMLISAGPLVVAEQSRLLGFDSNLKPLWTNAFPDRFTISLAQGPGGVILVSANNDFSMPENRSSLSAFDSTGQTLWRVDFPDNFLGEAAVDVEGNVYVAGSEGVLHAIHSNGEKRWELPLEEPLRQPPSIATDGTVYLLGGEGTLFAVSAEGEALWEQFLRRPLFARRPVMDLAGRLHVAPGDNRIFVLEPDTGTVIGTHTVAFNSIHPGPLIGRDGTRYVVHRDAVVAIRPDGRFIWSLGANSTSGALGALTSSHLILLHAGRVSAIDLVNGEKVWEFAGQEYHPVPFQFHVPMVTGDGTVLSVSREGWIFGLRSFSLPEEAVWPVHGGPGGSGQSLRYLKPVIMSSDGPMIDEVDLEIGVKSRFLTGSLERVEVFADGQSLGVLTELDRTVTLANAPPGLLSLNAIGLDESSRELRAGPVHVAIAGPPIDLEIDAAGVTLSFPTRTNRMYQVLRSADLTDWTTFEPAITGDGQTVYWTDEGPLVQEGHRFYQIGITSP